MKWFRRGVKDEVSVIKVEHHLSGAVLFEGKVSSLLTPEDLFHFFFFRTLAMKTLHRKDTHDLVLSFAGLRPHEELVACPGFPDLQTLGSFFGVLFMDGEKVLRKTSAAPTTLSSEEQSRVSMVSMWRLRNEECEKCFQMFTNVEILELNHVAQMAHFPNNSKMMPHLTILNLIGLTQMQDAPNISSFAPNLKEIWICNCDIVMLTEAMLPVGLERLKMQYLRSFQSISGGGNGVGENSSWTCQLNYLWIQACPLIQLPHCQMSSLKELILKDLAFFSHFPDKFVLPNLTHLTLEECRLLKRLPTMSSSLLQSLRVCNAQQLKVTKYEFLAWKALKKLEISSWNVEDFPLFCHMLSVSCNIRDVTLDWTTDEEQQMRSLIQQNGSLISSSSHFLDICQRNAQNHEKALESVVLFLALRRWRQCLNVLPKEMVQMMARMLWITKCDVDAMWTKQKEINGLI